MLACWSPTALCALLLTADAPLPRVLLIGDSISQGYTLPTRDLLREVAEVRRIPTNGAHTRFGRDKLDAWLGDEAWAVIHANWGLHDLKIMDDDQRQVPLAEYEVNLRAIFERLRQTGATVIWAMTTPVPAGPVSPRRDPADVPRYNEVAGKLAEAFGFTVNDLYGFALPRLAEIQLPVNVHFKPAGYEALAGEVARQIKAALAARAR